MLSNSQSKLIVYATAWCPDCIRTRRLLDKFQIAYDWIDIDQDKDGQAFVEKVNHGNRSVPTILFPDGSTMVEPSGTDLAHRLNVTL